MRLIVEALDDHTDRGDRPAALRRLVARIEGMSFFSRERVPLGTNFMIALATNILINSHLLRPS